MAKSKVNIRFLSQIKSKLKEKTGKSLTSATPTEIREAFSGTVAVRGNIKAALYERNRLLRERRSR